jgi:hypothetical protein
LTVFIFGYYFVQYPEDFNLIKVIRNAEWRELGLTLLILIIASALLASIPMRKLSFKRKFLILLASFQLIFLSAMLFKMLDTYWDNKKVFEHLLLEYREKAKTDIKSGLIKIEYGGGLELPLEKEKEMNEKIDSVTRTYGVTYRNSGCIIAASLTKAQDEYVRLTKPFLDRRNGVGWEAKMKNQIAEIQNNYR